MLGNTTQRFRFIPLTLLSVWFCWMLAGCKKSDQTTAAAEKNQERHESSPIQTDDPEQLTSTAQDGKTRVETEADVTPPKDGLNTWDTEVLSSQASDQLKKLAKEIAHPEPRPERNAKLTFLVSPQFSCGPLRPTELTPAYRRGQVNVQRGQIPLTTKPMHQGAVGLAEALSKLTEPFQHATHKKAKFKLFQVQLDGGNLTTTQYVSISGRTKQGMVEQNATWQIQWQLSEGQSAPHIHRIQVKDYEEVHSTTPQGTWFADCTESVFGDLAAFRKQFLPGNDYWNERIEHRVGMGHFRHYGLAVGDVNGDGLDDLYLCEAGGLPNRLLLQKPDGTLHDVSASSGVDILNPCYGSLWVDLDNDGDQDLVVGMGSRIMVFANDGEARFRLASVIKDAGDPYSLSAADYDNDGDLDLYICSYSGDTNESGQIPAPTPYQDANNGGRNMLLRNDIKAGAKDWIFTDVTDAVGIGHNNSRFSFAATWEDFDNDGDLDLYVGNDFGRNNLYQNEGGKFRDVAATRGVEDGAFGMSVSWGDFNRDGWMDIYIANMFSAAGKRIAYQRQFKAGESSTVRGQFQHLARGNTLYQSPGNSLGEPFRDVSIGTGVTMGRWAWSSLFGDINNDGWEDLLVNNGYVTRESSSDL